VAGLGLYALLADGELAPEVICAASTRDQAGIVWDIGRRMILLDKRLQRQTRINHTAKSITGDGVMGGTMKAVAGEAGPLHGTNPSVALVDELHTQPNGELLESLDTGQGSRRQPLMFTITTADYERESPCNAKYRYATRVRTEELHDPHFLPVIFEAAADDDWTSPATWAKANPNLGVSVTREFMQRQCRKAVEEPGYENSFKRLHLNIRTQQDIRWLQLHRWDLGGADDPVAWRREQLERLAGRECFAGLDLSSTSDLTALVLLFPESDDQDGDAPPQRFTVLPWFWTPEDQAHKRERRAGIPYVTWSRQGFMELTPGDEVDYEQVRHRILDLADRFAIVELAADRLFQGAYLCQKLREDDGLPVIAFGQGFASMAAPCAEFGKLVNRGTILHGGNPALRWQAGNVTVALDAAGNMKPDRRKSTEKIDGVVCCIMALARAIAAPEYRSVYEARDMETF
jgi:phage terminase large subunit-like protein